MTIVRKFWAPAVGVVAIIVGLVIANAAPPASFGWFAYSPLSDTTVGPPYVTGQFWIGAVIAVAGLALVAGWVGYRIGARRRATPTT